MEKVSRRLEQAMTMKDITAAELSRLTGISKSSLSRYMSGDYNPNNDKLEKLSRALNVNEAWLLGYDEVDMERESDEVRQEKSLTIEAEMAEMMLKKISELYRTLSFQQQVDLFEIARKMEVENENAK